MGAPIKLQWHYPGLYLAKSKYNHQSIVFFPSDLSPNWIEFVA
jgi:hypothetical protein